MAEQDILDAIAALALTVAAIDAKVGAATITVISPVTTTDDIGPIIQGDDYSTTEGREIPFNNATGAGWPSDLTEAVAVVRVMFDAPVEYPCTIITPTGVNKHIHLELSADDTADMPDGVRDYRLVVTLDNGHVQTLAQGHWTVVETNAPAEEGS